MKKLTTLFLSAGLVFAASAPASAVDIKIDGSFEIQHTQKNNANYSGTKQDRTHQQVRLGLTAAVSESLSGYFQVESKWDWGTNDYGTDTAVGGTAFDGARPTVRMRQAYIDWIVPGTPVKVRMGRHDMKLPALANGKNVVFWAAFPSDGISLTAPVTDWLSLNAFWARLKRGSWAVNDDNEEFDKAKIGDLEISGWVDTNFNQDTTKSREIDLFALTADLNFAGIAKVSPFVAYANIGKGLGFYTANNNVLYNGKGHAIWAGATGAFTMFDPFTIAASATYGDRCYDGDQFNAKRASQHGWFFDAKFSYKTSYVTPTLLAWWGSGDSSKDNQEYRGQHYMPSMGGRFKGSYGFFNGSNMLDNEFNNNHNGQGTWGLRLALENISFLKGLTHELAVVYAGGTNNSTWATKDPVRYLTSKDTFFEIDFGTTYKIYKNLTLGFEFAYIFEDFKTQENDGKFGNFKDRAVEYENGWKAALYLGYKF